MIWVMAYTYKMLQIPPNVIVEKKAPRERAAAMYLEEVVSEWAQNGWEFYSVESIGIWENPGCLTALFGAKATITESYVVVFRREV
jgi:hypothetical protein